MCVDPTGWVGDNIGARWSLAYGAIISLVAVLGLIWFRLARRTPEGGVAAGLRSLRRGEVAIAATSAEHA